jgi:YesN/AraC family two-component response regulator
VNISFEAKLNQDNEWFMQKNHFHDEYEILLSLTDAGKIFIEDKTFPLERGTLIFLQDTTLHRTIAEKDVFYERYVIHFSRETIESISTNQTNMAVELCSASKCVKLGQDQLFSIIPILKNILKNEGNDFGSDIKRNIAFIEFLLKVNEYFMQSEKSERSLSDEINTISSVIYYIQNNLNSNLSLDFLAEKFYISKYHLCRIFKESTGFTVREFIINSRIIKARELLNINYSVQETGEKSGFNNNAHFIRTFKKLTGISPGKFKSL